MAKARNEGRLFSRIEWPKDPEIVSVFRTFSGNRIVLHFTYVFLLKSLQCLQKEQVKRLHLLLTVKDSAANIPKNLEARRRLQFFTNSLFMDMPPAKPVCEMMPFR